MSLIPKRGTVYVVDDDEAVRDSLQWLLEGKDYRVKCFDAAESFLSRFDPREVACLIADIRMDGMSGLELQDRLLERRSPLPVTFITGHGDVPMAVTTMKKGAEDFIEKPFKEDELVSLVEKMLDRARVDFSKHQEAASRDALLSRLTTREAQVLERFPAEMSQTDLLARITALNADATVHGILVQLPLPKHIAADRVIEAIASSKDVDGYSVESAGRLVANLPGFRPCTPWGCMRL